MAPPPPRPAAAPAARPRRTVFDPWNYSSTGHQRAENRLAGSTSWRTSRTAKLASQFKFGGAGGKSMYDSVGAGSELFGKDGRKENGGWVRGAAGLREKGCQDVRGLLSAKPEGKDGDEREGKRRKISSADEGEKDEEAAAALDKSEAAAAEKKIFDGLCVFINGSTAPMVGDHRLKQLLAENGARVSIALGRRTVTHVILGTPNGGAAKNSGAGGGLAASKIQKEILRVGGKGVKYVGVDW